MSILSQNMFLAIISDSYNEVKAENEAETENGRETRNAAPET